MLVFNFLVFLRLFSILVVILCYGSNIFNKKL